MIGGMVLAEVVVHGWDLARATGQEVDWDPGLLEVVPPGDRGDRGDGTRRWAFTAHPCRLTGPSRFWPARSA
jgi:hypothetical protein